MPLHCVSFLLIFYLPSASYNGHTNHGLVCVDKFLICVYCFTKSFDLYMSKDGMEMYALVINHLDEV
jgi:hypothetical protein